ncbi:hypothetical protein AMTR_s00062p00116740 [Amborella trichopoda]|uniref:Uncharacterized protein n=1 Tax=Amborella trichopoda TaxID=13333 RepID=U5DAR4_AMBTC|nr:hypothetical protein AMTR_s00062p00116740 [Amborella trichopoda]
MISHPYSRSDTLFSSTPRLYSIPSDNQYAIPSIVRSAILSASLKPVVKRRVESNAYRLSTGLINSRVNILHYRERAIYHMDKDNLYFMGKESPNKGAWIEIMLMKVRVGDSYKPYSTYYMMLPPDIHESGALIGKGVG